MRAARILVTIGLSAAGCGRIDFDFALPPDAGAAPLLATVPVSISAMCNLWGAGHATPPAVDPGGAGILPVELGLPAATGRYFVITGVTGTIQYGPGLPINDADGTPIPPDGGYTWGGLVDSFTTRERYLSAVYLDAQEPVDPAPPAPTLDTTAPEFAGIGLRQLFFVGDGLTGDGAGSAQRFEIPDTATRLFLGFDDGPGTPPGPGAYADNTGAVAGSIEIY